jgi:rhodanese-related sulfurtransferase
VLLFLACASPYRIPADTLARALAERPDDYVVVDVRSEGEWSGSAGHIPGALHRPWPGVKETAASIPARPDQTVVLVCFTGHRSQWAMEAVDAALESPVIDLRGGMMSWWSRGLPVVVEPKE